MEETKFFVPKSKPSFKFFKKDKKLTDDGQVENLQEGLNMKKLTNIKKPSFSFNKKSKGNGNNKTFLKALGAGGGVLLLVVGIIALLVFLFVVKPAYALIDVTTDLKKDFGNIEDAFVTRDIGLFKESLDEVEKI